MPSLRRQWERAVNPPERKPTYEELEIDNRKLRVMVIQLQGRVRELEQAANQPKEQ